MCGLTTTFPARAQAFRMNCEFFRQIKTDGLAMAPSAYVLECLQQLGLGQDVGSVQTRPRQCGSLE